MEDPEKFILKWPTFLPGGVLEVARGEGIHYWRLYKRWLRGIWRGEDDANQGCQLAIMLGIERGGFGGLGHSSWLPLASPLPEWTTGRFEYQPACDFQRALHLLFRNSWRAKVCAWCRRCFVADKPAQLYCGTGCYERIKRLRNLDWWRKNGAGWRAKQRAKKSHRKRGK
jgi:hypothetical protein